MPSLTGNWIQVAEVVGAVQGFVLAAVLAEQRKNRAANRLLATLMATMAIYLAAGPYYTAGLVRVYPHFIGISYQTPWVFGPLVYLYARAASDRSWRFTWKALLHFVPVTITTIAMMPVYMMSGPQKIAVWERWSVEGATGVIAYLDPLKYVSGIAYSAATTVYLVRHRRDVERSYSNVEAVSLRWLFRLSAATGAIWVLVTSLKIAQVSTAIRDDHVAIAIALLVYGIGYMGLKQPEIFRFETAEPPVQEPTIASVSSVVESETSVPRAERGGLARADALQLKESLVRLMEREQPWKESELTLTDLASRLNSTPHKVSLVLNSEMRQTFYDFVNGYRVREVQRRIRAGDARTLKMLALAMDAGFASKSAFNDVFKKHTSQTPSAFRQAVGVATARRAP
jgi:AraC-like DNA-binding protein